MPQHDHPSVPRLRRLETLTDGALARLGVDELLVEVLGRVRDLLDVDTVAVLLLDASHSHLVATAAQGLEEEIRQGVRIPLGRGFAGRIAAERRAVVIDEVDHSNVLNPILRERGVRSLLGVPLVAEDEILGVLHVGTLRPHRFTDEDTQLLQLAADRLAASLRAGMSRSERVAAAAIQRSLLPGALPAVAGLELAARYVPGGGGDVGGDWYDVFVLPSGRLCVVVGDVVGHGLAASVTMGRLRDTVRAHALLTEDPAELLSRLDTHVRYFERDAMATVTCLVVDDGHGEMRLCSAGHPPPVLAAPGAPAALVDLTPTPPIGVGRRGPRTASTVLVPDGATLVLYTDGLVERRGESLDEGLRRLTEAVVPGPADAVCVRVMGQLVGSDPTTDDIALLVLSRSALAEPEELTLLEQAVPEVLVTIRQEIRGFLRRNGVGEEDVADVVLAVGEAAANVVEHAYGPAGGPLGIRMRLRGTRLGIELRDEGRWREARGTDRGRGLLLMKGLVDGVQVRREDTGTRVEMVKEVAR